MNTTTWRNPGLVLFGSCSRFGGLTRAALPLSTSFLVGLDGGGRQTNFLDRAPMAPLATYRTYTHYANGEK